MIIVGIIFKINWLELLSVPFFLLRASRRLKFSPKKGSNCNFFLDRSQMNSSDFQEDSLLDMIFTSPKRIIMRVSVIQSSAFSLTKYKNCYI